MPEKVYDKPLLDKLGVRPGARVAVLGLEDTGFLRKLGARAGQVVRRRGARGLDAVFLQVGSIADLAELRALEASIARDGAVWVVHPKGRADLRDVDVIAAAKRAGLVDNKVVRFSATHSALRLVVPRARR